MRQSPNEITGLYCVSDRDLNELEQSSKRVNGVY